MIDQSRWRYIGIAKPIGAMMQFEPNGAMMPPAGSGLPPRICRHLTTSCEATPEEIPGMTV